MTYHHWTLDNGLAVVGERHPQMRSVSLGFFVRTGSRDEPPPLNGVSHFLEHMLFKGSARRSGKEIDETFDRLGAEYNAFTGHEYTVYYARVLPEHLEALLELLADMMRPALRPEDFQTEKQVILEEIALYQDRPGFVLQSRALQAYYEDHPLGQEVLGSAESIRALSAEQMRAYYERRYAPNNMTLAAVGQFDPDELHRLARAHCAGWPARPTERLYPPVQLSEHSLTLQRENVSRQHVTILTPAPAYQDPQREAMDLLVDVWGHPGNSRLHWALVDKGLVDYATASYQAQDHAGVVSTSLSCDPERTPEVLEIVRRQVERLVREGISPAELEAARNRVVTALAVEGEQSLRRLFSFAFDFLYDQPYHSLEALLDAYRRVTVDEVNRALEAYPFAPRTLATLGPRQGPLPEEGS